MNYIKTEIQKRSNDHPYQAFPHSQSILKDLKVKGKHFNLVDLCSYFHSYQQFTKSWVINRSPCIAF